MIKYRLKILFICCFALLVFVGNNTAHCEESLASLPGGDFTSLQEIGVASVEDILDPLTIRLTDGRTVVLAGVNFPDLDYYQPGNLSVTAVEILKDFLKGKKIILYQTKKSELGRTNRMGHQIAQIVRKEDKSWVQGTLLLLGLARVRTEQKNPEMAEQMLSLEQAAREEKIGLWSVNAFEIMPPEKAATGNGNFGIVEGKVLSISIKNNKLFLHFGHNSRKDFTVGISSSGRRVFSKRGINPQSWTGKTIRVRGWLENLDGPYIEIDHPEAIEFVQPLSDPTQTSEDTKAEPNDTEPTKKSKNSIFNKGSALPEVNKDPMVERKGQNP